MKIHQEWQEFKRKLSYAHTLVRIRLRSQPYKYIFILSHMRSGSSLLVHLLRTNLDICAYGEAHLSYHSSKDLNRLLCKAKHHLQDCRFAEKYIADKLLHNYHTIEPELFLKHDCFFIFLLREPQQSLSSMLGLKSHESRQHEEQALAYYTSYYVERLGALEKQVEIIPQPEQRCIFITHEQLIGQTNSVFDLLQTTLSLQHSFSEQYQISPVTGKEGIGDPSSRIKQGKILRNYQPRQVEIPAELLYKATAAFQKSCIKLQSHCKTIGV